MNTKTSENNPPRKKIETTNNLAYGMLLTMAKKVDKKNVKRKFTPEEIARRVKNIDARADTAEKVMTVGGAIKSKKYQESVRRIVNAGAMIASRNLYNPKDKQVEQKRILCSMALLASLFGTVGYAPVTDVHNVLPEKWEKLDYQTRKQIVTKIINFMSEILLGRYPYGIIFDATNCYASYSDSDDTFYFSKEVLADSKSLLNNIQHEFRHMTQGTSLDGLSPDLFRLADKRYASTIAAKSEIDIRRSARKMHIRNLKLKDRVDYLQELIQKYGEDELLKTNLITIVMKNPVFSWRYLVRNIGYVMNPLEIEARNAETNIMMAIREGIEQRDTDITHSLRTGEWLNKVRE